MPRKQSSSSSGAPKSFFCRRCQKRVRLTKGWSRGASVRKHYWRHHPEVMRVDKAGAR